MWIYTLQAESSLKLDPHFVCEGLGSTDQSSWPVLSGFVSEVFVNYQRDPLSFVLLGFKKYKSGSEDSEYSAVLL